MNKNYLKTTWKHEEELAHIHGWDFSHINGRYREQICRGIIKNLLNVI